MINEKTHIILCNGASLSKEVSDNCHLLKLTYNPEDKDHLVNIKLPHFVRDLNCYFPDRIKDLLEIAGYIYAADRLIKRGGTDQLEYHSWARNLEFVIKVRDFDFWNDSLIKELLKNALLFVSGDNSYTFSFEPGAMSFGQLNLFDQEGFLPEKKNTPTITLFSGGLDSLAGIIQTLETTSNDLILVSHRSNNPGVTKTQDSIFNKLIRDYPGRINYFWFECNLKKRAIEETQRTRIFLYTTIAYSLASIYDTQQITVFENGITSINFSKRADLINARASRTTHPKTLFHLKGFFSAINNKTVEIQHPFLFKTKTDIFEIIHQYNKHDYISLSVSCTKTFLKFENNSRASHCGGCSQCIDRRFAAFASGLQEYDAIYDFDLTKNSFQKEDTKKQLYDYIKLAYTFSKFNLDSFYYEMQDILVDLADYIDGSSEYEKVNKIFELCNRHFQQISKAFGILRSLEDPFRPKIPNSFFTFIEDREYFKEPIEQLIKVISEKLKVSIPEAFNTEKPKNENSLNDMINAILLSEKENYSREFPAVRFSFSKVIPDHSINNLDLFIETKYLRGKTSKSTITDGIASDITKYPEDKFKLFIIFDPERKIANDNLFAQDFERKPKCKICIIR